MFADHFYLKMKNEEEIRIFYCLALKNVKEIRGTWGKKKGILAKIFPTALIEKSIIDLDMISADDEDNVCVVPVHRLHLTLTNGVHQYGSGRLPIAWFTAGFPIHRIHSLLFAGATYLCCIF